MKVTIISYSLSGNNNALAERIAAEFAAEHIKISEPKPRTMRTIMWDVLFNRTPHVIPGAKYVPDSDLIIFMGPVWIGRIATPLRAYFKHFKLRKCKYAFVSISGGADGPNPKLAHELNKRMGRQPEVLIDMHIADLLPQDPKPTRENTSHYLLNENDIKNLTGKIVTKLHETLEVKENIY